MTQVLEEVLNLHFNVGFHFGRVCVVHASMKLTDEHVLLSPYQLSIQYILKIRPIRVKIEMKEVEAILEARL